MAAIVAQPPKPFYTTTAFHEQGVDPRLTGTINLRNFVDVMGKLGIQPRDGQWLAEIDQGARQINNLDLRYQYNDIIVPMNILAKFSNVDQNSMNAFLYQVLCPMRITNQFNFSVDSTEIYMAPFDAMNPLNIARETGYKREFKQYTLQMYKRSQSAEYTLLADPLFGEKTLQRMQYAIDKQAELTMMNLIAHALVEYPFYEMLLKFQHPVNAFLHAREALIENLDCFAGAENSDRLINHIRQGINDSNNHDSLVLPAGAGKRLIGNAGEPQPVTSWRPYYDTAERRLLVRAYDEGVSSLASIPVGNGRRLNVYELSEFKGYSSDPTDSVSQPLGTRLMLGEITVMQPVHLDYLDSPSATLSPKMLDVVAPEQTPMSMEMKLISFREYLKYNMMFISDDGESTESDPQHMGLSGYYQKLAEEYNLGNTKDAFKMAFREAAHVDNNNCATIYLQGNAKLEDMYGFRHFDGFLCYNDVTERIEVPRFVGDIEPKTLPPSYLFSMAEAIASKIGNAADFRAELRKILPNSRAHTAGVVDLTDAGPRPIVKIVPGLMRTPIPTTFSAAAAGTLLVPLASETKEQYLARVTPPAIHDALEDGSLDATESAWVHMLQHVPDQGLDAFLTLVHATLKDGCTPSDEDNAALAKFATELESKTRSAHVTETLKSAVRYINKAPANQTVGAVLASRAGLPWLGKDALTKANATPEQVSVLAASVSEHIEDLMGAENLGHAAGGLLDVPDHERRFTWMHYNELLRTHTNASDNVKFVYVTLLQCPFNYFTCDKLARLGLTLFRQSYLRMFIEQHADAFVVLRAGYDTWFLAVGHGQVLTGVGAAEGSFAMHAQMHMGIIPDPVAVRNMRMLPHALPTRHVGGRTLEPIRNWNDVLVQDAIDRRSVFVLSTPVKEDRYEYPISIYREQLFKAPDTGRVSPIQKISITDILRKVIPDDYLDEQSLASDNFAQFYGASLAQATHIHRSAAYYASSNAVDDKQFILKDGTGPLGSGARCMPAAALAFMNLATFPTEARQSITV